MQPHDNNPQSSPTPGEPPANERKPAVVESGVSLDLQPELAASSASVTAPASPDAIGSPPLLDPGDPGSGGSTPQAEGSTSSPESESDSDEATADESEGEEASETESSEGEKKRKRKRKKKKKNPVVGGEASEADKGERPAHDKIDRRPSRPASDRAPFHVGEEVFGKVTAILETAIMVDLSGKALAIFDRTEMEPDDLIPTVGDRFVARVHNDGARGGLVVLTRKPLREEEVKPAVEAAAKSGTLVQGLITGAIKGGVEVDIGGIRAFAPASGMDLHPVNANFTTLVGQRLEFKILQFKNQGRDVVVTRRPMLEAEAHERRKQALGLLTEGQNLRGVVRTVVEWGAFVALPEAENLEGLVHVSELSHDPRARIQDLVKPGDQFEVKILKIDEKGKIWLSRKALLEDPWAESRRKYPPHARAKGVVTKLEPFGAFVELEPGLEGLIHVSDLSFERIEHANEVLKEGQEVEVVIHHFDLRNKKIGLHLAPPPEQAEEEPQKLLRGGPVRVEVVKADNAGLVVRILGMTGRAARGFIPAGQTGTSRGTDLRKHFKAGTKLETKVVELDPKRGEPKLSIRGLREDEERRATKEYRAKLKAESSFGTLGDLLAKHLASQKSGDE